MPIVNLNNLITFPEFESSVAINSNTWIVGLNPVLSAEIRFQVGNIHHDDLSGTGNYTHPELDYMILSLSGGKANWDDVTTIVQLNSAGWAPDGNIDYPLRSLSANWQTTFLEYSTNSANYGDISLVVQSNSADWADHRDLGIRALTGYWDEWTSTYSTVSSNSANWISVYSSVISNSSDWSTHFDSSLIQSASGGWNNIQTIVEANSAYWAPDGNIDFDVRALSSNWQETYTLYSSNSSQHLDTDNIVQSNSADWADHRDLGVRSLTGFWDEWTETYAVVSATSANWDSVFLNVNVSSSTWDNVATTVQDNSAAWIVDNDTTQDVAIRLLSSGWDSTQTTVTDNSANWDSSYNATLSSPYWNSSYVTVNTSSSYWGEHFNSSLLETTSSDWDSTYTVVQLNSADWSAHTDLTLLSTAWEDTYLDYSSNSANFISTYTTVNLNSSLWASHSDLTLVQNASGNWDSTYTTVNLNSASWVGGGFDASLVQSTSANWDSTYTTVNLNSSLWGNNSLSGEEGNLAVWDASGNTSDSGINILRLKHLISTGLISGGEISINSGDNSKFDVLSGNGVIINNSNIDNPTIYEISWGNYSNQTITNLATQTVTYLGINTSGNIVQLQNVESDDRRNYIILGSIAHTNNTNIGAVVNNPDFIISPSSQLRDLRAAIGIINIGNTVYPNGTNLSLNKTEGKLSYNGLNYQTDILSPSVKTYPAQILASLRLRTQTGQGSTSTTLDVSNYDNGGTITSISGTKAQNLRVFLTIAGNLVVQYGQTLYDNLSKAVAGLRNEQFVVFENLSENSLLIGAISVLSNATDLTDDSSALFYTSSKFGEIGTGLGGTSVSTLQNSYDNSITPEILTNSTLGAVSIKRGSISDSDNVLEVLNGSDIITLSIDGLGSLSASNILNNNLTPNKLVLSDLNKNLISSSIGEFELSGTFSVVSETSANWNSTYTTVNLNSALWASHSDLTLVQNASGNWDSTYTTLQANSASWGAGGYDDTALQAASANWDSTYTTVNANSGLWESGQFGITIDGAGSVITTGLKGFLRIPYNCVITQNEITADQSGSIEIDIWKDTYANFPPTSADSITASAKPTLSTQQISKDVTLTGWTTTLTEGDYLAFNVNSVSTVTRVTLFLKAIKQ